jgi:hypothetical protein
VFRVAEQRDVNTGVLQQVLRIDAQLGQYRLPGVNYLELLTIVVAERSSQLSAVTPPEWPLRWRCACLMLQPAVSQLSLPSSRVLLTQLIRRNVRRSAFFETVAPVFAKAAHVRVVAPWT